MRRGSTMVTSSAAQFLANFDAGEAQRDRFAYADTPEDGFHLASSTDEKKIDAKLPEQDSADPVASMSVEDLSPQAGSPPLPRNSLRPADSMANIDGINVLKIRDDDSYDSDKSHFSVKSIFNAKKGEEDESADSSLSSAARQRKKEAMHAMQEAQDGQLGVFSDVELNSSQELQDEDFEPDAQGLKTATAPTGTRQSSAADAPEVKRDPTDWERKHPKLAKIKNWKYAPWNWKKGIKKWWRNRKAKKLAKKSGVASGPSNGGDAKSSATPARKKSIYANDVEDLAAGQTTATVNVNRQPRLVFASDEELGENDDIQPDDDDVTPEPAAVAEEEEPATVEELHEQIAKDLTSNLAFDRVAAATLPRAKANHLDRIFELELGTLGEQAKNGIDDGIAYGLPVIPLEETVTSRTDDSSPNLLRRGSKVLGDRRASTMGRRESWNPAMDQSRSMHAAAFAYDEAPKRRVSSTLPRKPAGELARKPKTQKQKDVSAEDLMRSNDSEEDEVTRLKRQLREAEQRAKAAAEKNPSRAERLKTANEENATRQEALKVPLAQGQLLVQQGR